VDNKISMTDYQLRKQLKALRDTNPDKEWVGLLHKELISNVDKGGAFSLRGIKGIFSFAIQNRIAYPAVAVFVFGAGLFSFVYGRAMNSDMAGIIGSLENFSIAKSPSDKFVKADKIRIVMEDAERVVANEVAEELKSIAAEAGASYTSTSSLASLDSSEAVSEVMLEGNDVSVLSHTTTALGVEGQDADNESYTVVFKENSDSRERFNRLLKDRIEVKFYSVNEQIKDKDEQTRNQIGSILNEASAALNAGELIEALELVNAAEKSLMSMEEAR